MFSRRTILFGTSILLLTLLSIFGLKLYCAQCSEKPIAEQITVIRCPPPTQTVYREEDILNLSKKLLRCDRYTDHKVIAGFVTEVRNSGIHSTNISEILSSMLPYQSEIYQNRDKWEVLRLRSYILLTLGEIGFPDSAIPILVDALAYVDERMKVVELGSAIKVVGNFGVEGSLFGESVISAYNRVFSDEEFSLERYEVGFSKDEATTIQIEIVRSLGKICNKKDDYAIKFLNSVLTSSDDFGFDKRVTTEAQRSLNIILQRESDRKTDKGISKGLLHLCTYDKKERSNETPGILNGIERSPYIEAKDRKEVINKNISLTDHNGIKGEFTELIDRPTLLTFFYTRCQNDRKCSATISHLASLQNHLRNLSLSNKVRLVAVTFEPQHDSPDLLKRYLTDRGVKLGNEAMAIKLESEGHKALLEEMHIPVGYNSGWVNGHGIEAVLLDKDKRIARKYNSLFWNTSELLADFTRLLGEGSRE
jgi:cytochrome oxidase Cu insertion factor (SCO1/SenC/PrrC family)